MAAEDLSDSKELTVVTPGGIPRTSEGAGEFIVEQTDMGTPDSLRYTVLTHVLEEKYDGAVSALQEHLEKPSPYPQYYNKVERFISHASDLVYAIRAKRNFPGMNSLTRSKQQELRERFREHFKELQVTLKKIEKIQFELRNQDAKSTIWVVRTLWYCGLSIFLLGLFLDLTQGGLLKTTFFVTNDSFDRVSESILNLLGL